MSLRPLKKTDMGKEWIGKRLDRHRLISPEYHLIITEGTKTEPAYFGAIADYVNNRFGDRIHVEVFGEGKNTKSLFETAKSRADHDPNFCKHVWVVYDKDDFPSEYFNATAELCGNNSSESRVYHALWSNQCIELWFLLHFDYLQSDITRFEYYPKLSKRLNDLSQGDYKKNRADMFSILRPMMNTAICNAERLYEGKKDQPPADASPCTTVFAFVKQMMPYLKQDESK